MARAIDSEAAYRFLSEQFVKETGAFSKGVNKGLNIARSAMRNPDAIPTLRPVSRERVELYTNRLWPGCPRCSMTNDEAFDAGGAHEFRVLDDFLYYCDSNYGWEGEKIGYCPWCGKPLGKATELKHIEKLEVLLND